jgi:hypothetical protein
MVHSKVIVGVTCAKIAFSSEAGVCFPRSSKLFQQIFMDIKRLSIGLSLLPLALLTLWQSGSCKTASTKTANQEPKRVAAGVWGGSDVRLNVSDSASQLQFACAHGEIQEPLVLTAEGHFSVRGTFFAETPGPTRVDDPPRAQPALYEGEIKDQVMTLAITLTETKKPVGNFTLEFGKSGRLRRCL